MNFSNIALKLYALTKAHIIKNRKDFWFKFYNKENVNEFDNLNLNDIAKELTEKNIKITCVYDDDFPDIQPDIPLIEKPYLFAYKGDLSLLYNINENIAVIGCLFPDEETKKREQTFINALLNKNYNIVAGLAVGCDTIAHLGALKCNAKTIAFLPSTLDCIYPTCNVKLSSQIAKTGLLITEYVGEASSHTEFLQRFIERDRLQAMFSFAIILTASYIKGEGDCGSKYAMQKAKNYHHKLYVMYNKKLDSTNQMFKLNRLFIKKGATILTSTNIDNL